MPAFYLSSLLAFTGGHMVNYAVILYLQEKIGSDLLSGIGFGLSFGSSIVFGWFAGVLCDRIAIPIGRALLATSGPRREDETPTDDQRPRGMPASPKKPFILLLEGPIVEGPSCRLPYTLYGTRLSRATWYTCAMGSAMRRHETPRFSVIEMPPSCETAIRLPLLTSTQMSWWSPPG